MQGSVFFLCAFSGVADFRQIIPFIKEKEGGLTGRPSDSASSDPAPCGYDAKYDAPYHTNRGITWTTFKDNADRLGYAPSCNNFLQMPDSIWEKIYKERFWDIIKADDINNQGIANAYVFWAWQSGRGGARSLMRKMLSEQYGVAPSEMDSNAKIVEQLNRQIKRDKKRLFDNMVSYREQFYYDIAPPGSSNHSSLRGWLNAWKSFTSQNAGFASGSRWMLPIAIMGIGAFVYLKFNRK